MLALRSYEQANGFSVLDADELFFINGGSESYANYGDSRQIIPSKSGIETQPLNQDQKNRENRKKYGKKNG